ncbi:MAG: hypothetical protein A3J81_06740 [Nitrospirae bacterium RIFOXYB2_FULL_43_5]|nr:MAG: hypothetical protein A2X54_09530 [Nitrospirae bacterium GWF2_44_13]OGW32584.1 MAG: hypothetical protein A2088_02450 [Nitrospirae bacterium GWD2_44_7]OGW63498.1 MAG: hypothetical protein A2222_06690 [Nitrospirae bacterium RIFOXYA2_FULL_44_9]OGW73264.1 MAG: hypothetical protein A2484_00225 [Nitrospirae bacterium RIFOXYC2_FULL_44_7]OGW75404.1 MAG: hypothetical protein A3J81_06740 [Nitrospirae bacterium RIFOXYB2_FULL_43_5]
MFKFRSKKTTKQLFRKSIYFLVFCLIIFLNQNIFAYTDKEMDEVLAVADSMFKAMKENNLPAIWPSLTEKSKSTIIDDVVKAQKNGGYPREQIKDDFEKRGPIYRVYWRFFLIYFNPDMVLNESKWEVGYIKKDKAEILITHAKSDTPARLIMVREEGSWKVGLVETFWTRK